MNSKMLAGAVAVVLLIVAIPLVQQAFFAKKPEPPSEKPELKAPPEEPPPQPRMVTAEEYNELLTGMTYWQVVDIIGDESDESSSEYHPGVEGYTHPSLTVWHEWRNEDGSFVRLGFVSDKLRKITQEGLK